MIYNGIQFTVVATETPGVWRWQFAIDGKTRTGRTEARLELLAIRRVEVRINRELKLARRSAGENGHR